MRCGSIGLNDPENEAGCKGEQTDTEKPQEEFLAPVSRADFREELEAFADEVTKTLRRDEHEQTHAGTSNHHRHVDNDHTNESAQSIFPVPVEGRRKCLKKP